MTNKEKAMFLADMDDEMIDFWDKLTSTVAFDTFLILIEGSTRVTLAVALLQKVPLE